ncbi:MAG TPA: hypothetical protein VFX49_05515, partial [Chloroflexota bacterium]|nr:hypothetical protein [Chloroflexota bacterium]
QTAGNADQVKALNDRLTAAGNLRTTMQTGSTLRGQLLNAWGWDTFGIGLFATGAAMVAVGLVAAAGLAYELRTRPSDVEAPATARVPALAAVAR